MNRLALAVASVALAATLPACGDKAPEGGSGSGTPTPPAAGTSGGYGYAAQLGTDLDKKAGDALQKGRGYVLSKRDEASGGIDPAGQIAAGYSAFGALALVATTRRESVATDATIAKTLEFVASKQHEDGSIWSNAGYKNYETAVALSAFATARIAKFRDVQQKAREFLVSTQIAGDEADLSYGGFPYTSKSDPTAPADLSNAQFAATALHDGDLPKDHPAWTRILAYTARVINRSETNTTTVKRKDKDLGDVEVVSGNDGGAAYAPGVSKAGLVKRSDGKYEARSYGSMTYALLKCSLFAGLKADDPRVKAAYGWIAKHFTVDRNPGFEQDANPAKAGMQGYYYYALTMAQSLAELERSTGRPAAVTDADGKAHDWRRELAAKLVSLQRPDGSWVNDVSERWDEGNPFLATAYAMQALAVAQGRLP